MRRTFDSPGRKLNAEVSLDYLSKLFGLQDKVAAVIGGGGVLAGAMAKALAGAGASIAILDLNEENARNMAGQIAEIGVKTTAIAVDATSKQGLEKAERQIHKELGPCSILVNAPGINSGTPFFDITEAEWHKILDVNLKSMFLACQVFARQMIDNKLAGSIINISSASSGPPLSKVFTYGISKAGVNNMTQFLAREWATKGVRVNAIAPGFFPAEQNRKILTPERVADIMRHTPMNRFGEAEELAGATVWLASENASSFVTGAIIRVDGGYTAMTI
ncbi:SDR family oxidoreductase [candidate division KSB1 bacterium]|nr:SDR family oxidoreductase [candidate division KSB1 bacterium]